MTQFTGNYALVCKVLLHDSIRQTSQTGLDVRWLRSVHYGNSADNSQSLS
jgi:hypothetical protein